jgi:hypothetical protein
LVDSGAAGSTPYFIIRARVVAGSSGCSISMTTSSASWKALAIFGERHWVVGFSTWTVPNR